MQVSDSDVYIKEYPEHKQASKSHIGPSVVNFNESWRHMTVETLAFDKSHVSHVNSIHNKSK